MAWDDDSADLLRGWHRSRETQLILTCLLPCDPCLPLPRCTSAAQLAMKACPYRATFYPKLGNPAEVVMLKLEDWLSALENIVKKEEDVFKAGVYGEI